MTGAKFKKPLKILGREFSVVKVHALADAGGRWGDCVAFGQAIRIEENMHPQAEAHVLVHEIMHAYDDILGIGLKHRQMNSLATSILDLIRNNPQLVKLIKESE